MNKKSISILGCGWLGYPLAQSFVNDGWFVKGSTTTESKLRGLKKEGVLPYLIDFNLGVNPVELMGFLDSDYLIINIPPGSSPDLRSHYKTLREHIEESLIPKLVFISSTSAYSMHDGVATEDDAKPEEGSKNRTLAYEHCFANLKSVRSTIVRFAGLVGKGRHPGQFFRNGKVLIQPNAPVNIIHLDDCIGLIKQIIRQECWGEIINACADEHPTKVEFYSKAARLLNHLPPPVEPDLGAYPHKTISNAKSKQLLQYKYKYPDPIHMLDSDGF